MAPFNDKSKETGISTGTPDFLNTERGKTKSSAIELPSISLPKGGGALKGIDEKFSVNAVNGTSSFSIPLPVSQARGVIPDLSLSYNSGAGNGIFGLGWNLSLPSIKRKTDKQLPQYLDDIDSDIFLFSEAEDLVPEFKKASDGSFIKDPSDDFIIKEKDSPDNLFLIRFLKPRIEGLFARIERWTKKDGTEIKWRVISKENVTTLFGWSANSRLSDPADSKKISEWFPEFVFDDKGNCTKYIYKHEDGIGFDKMLVHNRNRIRNNHITYTNLYPEKVLYCNKTPYKNFGDPFPGNYDFLFETVFDYGTTTAAENPETLHNWDFRPDGFSEYKSGFEIRTTRLCKRVLLFHHFKGANEYEGLVRSLNFGYDTSVEQDFTFLKSITSYGYIKKSDGSYSFKNLPPFEFGYQKHDWNSEVKTVSTDALVHAPVGIDEPTYQFVDLFNEGLAGILSEQASGWYYKHNLGLRPTEVDNVSTLVFEKAKLVSPKPSFNGLGSQLLLADLDADGGKQIVNYNSEPKGFFELNDDNEWQPYRNFRELPNINFNDPFTRMIDLNGDGKAELVISEDNVFTWFQSEGRKGFKDARKTVKPFDEEAGPALVFADQKQTIFLADMSGDGLTDIVRIRHSEVCYWPNLGYGRFGAKITMDNAPLLDREEHFNPAYIKLADIDGSGTTDIIYLGKNKFSCWKNLSGNRFSTLPFEIPAFPEIHTESNVTVTDLLGNGVACIVWSSPLAKDAGAPLRYIDLMNSKKPHIMVTYKNNMGKEVTLEYTASTHFYIEDKLAGNPWVTKLHFPVHCVTKTITEDKITGYKFASSYEYHHGYYDHHNREFRGFGMVEQTDAETFEHWVKSGATNITEANLHQEPVITKQWFHTGAFLRNEKILTQFEHEYWYNEIGSQGFPVVHHEKVLADAIIIPAKGIPQSVIDNLSAEEYQEALRACKGMALRSEVFARDAVKFGNTEEAKKKDLTPYTVATHNCVIELLQPKGKNKHAVFIVKDSEAITYSYERDTEDPRIAHTLNIKLDEYGNVMESASVVYPRRTADASLPSETQVAQNKTSVIYTLNKFTNDAFDDDSNRQRLPAEVKIFELKGVAKTGDYYSLNNFKNILDDANSSVALYHELNKPLVAGKAQRRLIEHIKTLYYQNDLTASLPLLALESKAIGFESYQLAYTPELIADIFQSLINPLVVVPDALIRDEGKFTHSKDESNADDTNWWVRSGTIQYIDGGESVADAQNRFYVPISYTEPFGAKTKVKYYLPYFLFVEETEDALSNKSKVTSFNFRTLSPRRMQDANDNFSEVLTNELGLVKAMAVFGKGNQADELTGLKEETDVVETALIQSFFNPPATAGVTDYGALTNTGRQLLLNATARFVYDFDVYKNSGKPPVVASILRETHARDENGNANPLSKLQLSFEYSSGIGQVAMKKVQAEPGEAKRVSVQLNNSILVDKIDTTPLLRWIGNGKTILNNKGNAVKQYEPYFSVTHQYEDFKELVESGVTPVMYYDAVGRLVKTEMPDSTFSKVEFDSWKQNVYDANDTVLDSEWYKKRTDNTRPDFITDSKEQQAATKASLHTDTPNQLHFDTLGRPVLSIEHNKDITTNADELYYTKVDLDIEGNLRSVTDDRGNVVMQYKYDMLGNKVYQLSMDAGERFLLQNVVGNPLRTWDARNHEFVFEYDILHRPVIKRVKGGDGINPLEPNPLNHVYEKIIYGEGLPNNKSRNLRTKAEVIYDTAGKIETPEFDFKGNPKTTKRRFAQKYKEVADWGGTNPDAKLEAEEFESVFEYDALNRITEQTAPDHPINSVYISKYNEAGLIDSVEITQKGNKQPFVKNIDYNEKAQRTQITYGNDVTTKYTYDKNTFRLIHLETKRLNNDPLQDLYYTFDPVGNITHLQDKNIPDVFFNNQKIDGTAEYTYDALYRLRKASGREHAGQLKFAAEDNWNDLPFMKQYSPDDPMAWRNYTQLYTYDSVGNIKEMKHVATGGRWTRSYQYENNNNRLKSTSVGIKNDAGVNTNTFNYTAYPHHPQHGFITEMPHLQVMRWNFKDELQAVAKQKVVNGTPETTYYVYDGNGQRARKITEVQAGTGVTNPAKKSQRIYVGGIEVYREYDNTNTKTLERLTYHVMDDKRRIAMIETLLLENGNSVNERLLRYQFGNHLGSVSIETDENAIVISYEEYHPFGTTSYQAVDKTIKAAAKRYRYTGMERDVESGLYYHGARYYAGWLGRWLSVDPGENLNGINLYAYVSCRPTVMHDPNGKEGVVDDVVAGAKGVPKAVAEPFLLVSDTFAAGYVWAYNEHFKDPSDPYIEPTDIEFMSGTAERMRHNIIAGEPNYQNLRAGLVMATAMPTGGATPMVDNWVTVFEKNLSPDQAQSLLVQGTTQQVLMTGVGVGVSKATGSGWTGRGPEANPAGEAAMLDNLKQARTEAGKQKTGEATFAQGRDALGKLTNVKESLPDEAGGTHAEPQVSSEMSQFGGRTVAVDQVPCGSCWPDMSGGAPKGTQPNMYQGSMTGSLRVVTGRNPNSPATSPKSAALKAAQGKGTVEPHVEFVRPFSPPVVPTGVTNETSIDPMAPTQAEIEAQQSLPEHLRH